MHGAHPPRLPHAIATPAWALPLLTVAVMNTAHAELSHPQALQRLDEQGLSDVRGAGLDQVVLQTLQAASAVPANTREAKRERQSDDTAQRRSQGDDQDGSSRQAVQAQSAVMLATLDQQTRQATQLTASGVTLIGTSALVATTAIVPTLGVPAVGMPMLGLGLLGSLPRNR